MSRKQIVAITVLFIISTYSALGANVGTSSEDVVINNQTAPVKPVTELNSNVTSSTTETPTTATPANTTTAGPNPTTPTTTITPITNATTLPPNTTVAPTTTTSVKPNVTTTTIPTTLSPNVTSTTTTVKPTGAPPTTPVPSHRRFDGPSFIGGIVLALGLVAIGFVAFKFYKARTELNYHTL